MSGIRDHKLFTITIEGTHEFYPRDAYGEVCGELIRKPCKSVKRIVASLPHIAEAHARYWLQYSGILPGYTLTIDKGVEIDAFIEERVW